MFRPMISPIFKSNRLCVTACSIMHPRCCRPVAWKRRNRVPPLPGHRPATLWVHYTISRNTQSSAPEDGRNHRSKHVDLIGIISKPLLLYLIGCLYYLYHINTLCVWRNSFLVSKLAIQTASSRISRVIIDQFKVK